MTTNASPQFKKAQDKYLTAETLEEKIIYLDEMLREAPKHKSSENLLANLKTRKKRLILELEKTKKTRGKSSKIGIKKSDMQAVIIGKTHSGKSSLLSLLTQAKPQISSTKFTTRELQIGMMHYENTQIQIIENPAINSEYYDKGLTNSADTLIILVTSLEDISEIYKNLPRFPNQKIILVYNKIDCLDFEQKRKLTAYLDSKKYNYVLISTKTQENINELKKRIFQSFDKIRVYTKEPSLSIEKFLEQKRTNPMILKPGATIKDIAEKILHGFANKIKETKIWGPSSKFPGQTVGLNHVLKDMDIVEFKTR